LYKHYVADTINDDILGIINLNTIDEIFKDSEACRSFSRIVICFYEFPPCDTYSSELLPLCPERCWEIERVFEACGELTNFIVENLLNCSDPYTYYGSATVSNTNCSKSLKCIKQIIYK